MTTGIIATPSRTDSWNYVYTQAAQNLLRPEYTDNVYKGRPLLMLLRERGKKTTGGRYLVERVNLGITAPGGSYAKGTKMDLIDVDPFTAARYEWAYYRTPVVIYFQDEHQATSPEGRVRISQDKTREAVEGLMDIVNDDLCSTSKAVSTDLNTLIEAIPADPTSSGAFGQLDGAAAYQPGWRNQYYTTSTDFSAAGLTALRNQILAASQGGKYQHDVVLLDQTRFGEFLDLSDQKHSINTNFATKGGTKVADLGAGATSAAFMGRPVIWDAKWDEKQSGKALILNLDGIQLVEDSKHAWQVTDFKDTLVGGVDARVAWVRWVGQLTVSNRRTQAILTTLT